MSDLTDKAVRALLDWFNENALEYPWSDTSDPWAVWVSEVMLQQTTVNAVEPRFRSWMKRFPTAAALAAASEEEVLREWEGLGYYNRARNLAAAARDVTVNYGGCIPESSADLRQLPGVGEYIASAVASFAFDEPTAAIDANGRRIACRLAARGEWDRALEREFRSAVEAGMPAGRPGLLNAALMQLGQRICTPRNPSCGDCPLSSVCLCRMKGLQDVIPGKRRQEVIRKNTGLALLVHDERVLLVRRESGAGRGLWFFPASHMIPDLETAWGLAGELNPVVHSYTRYRERLRPGVYFTRGGGSPVYDRISGKSLWESPEGLAGRPMPSAYRRIAEELIVFLASSKANKQ